MSLQVVGLRFGLNLLSFHLCFRLCLCVFEGFPVPLHHLYLVGRGSSWTRASSHFPPPSCVPIPPTSGDRSFSVFSSSQTSPIFCLCTGGSGKTPDPSLPLLPRPTPRYCPLTPASTPEVPAGSLATPPLPLMIPTHPLCRSFFRERLVGPRDEV